MVDYLQCQHQVVAEDILYFCRLAKENWPRPLITGAFYGYFFALFGRQAAGGHLQIERVLDSEWIDFLCGPQCYYPSSRELGSPYRSRSLIESVRLHGKLWLDEMDVKPDIWWHSDAVGYRGDLQASLSTPRRNVLYSFLHGMGLWFYDFGPAWDQAGWWDHPALMKEIGELKKLEDHYLQKPYVSAADVLVVYDTHVFYYLAGNSESDPVSTTAVDQSTVAIYLGGAMVNPVHRNDLDKIDLDQYKIIFFVNTFYLTEKERQFIRTKVARNGRHLVWFYAPGYTDGKSLSVDFVSELVGMDLIKIVPDMAEEVCITHTNWPNVQFGVQDPVIDPAIVPADPPKAEKRIVDPLFVVAESKAEVFGHLTGTGQAAFARKQLADHTSWFCSLPIQNTAIIRQIMQSAHAHIYDDQDDVFYAAWNIISIHTKEGGRREIRLRNGTTLTIDLPRASTTLIEAETGKILYQ